MNNKSNIELLAPAGSFASLNAAINAGCDSVYLGITDFNMRATTKNFTLEDLPKVLKLCKSNKIKCYLTVNTLLYNNELERMNRVIDTAKRVGVDAIIAADFATIMYARSIGVNVHISTQLSISNIEGLRFFSKYTDRIVLARELSIEQVKEICTQIGEQNICGPKGKPVEIEVFGHGALCVAVSGRCGMSLYAYGRSANRGICSQICRREFKVIDKISGLELDVDNNYVMSSADLCTIGMIDILIDSGISTLKIEGRGRGAEYVDTVVKTYRTALDAVANQKYTKENIEKWNKNLEKVFNRGFTKGLYMGRTFDEWANGSNNKSKTEKILIGKVINFYSKQKVVHVEVLGDEAISIGDEYGIIGDTTGIVKGKIDQLMVNDKAQTTSKQGDSITFKINSKVRKGDFVFKFI